MKIVINRKFGGFGLSDEAIKLYCTLKGIEEPDYFSWEVKRDDPVLVTVVEKLGERANGRFARLKVVEIPDKVKWVIDEYDGMETIHEKHRSWS